MKKIISIFAIVFALTLVMSVSAFAVGFTSDTSAYADVTIDHYGEELLMDVTIPTKAGNDYAILLVQVLDPANPFPVSYQKANGTTAYAGETIAYINQIEADGETLTFEVATKEDRLKADGELVTDYRLYVGSNEEDYTLISIPVTYTPPVVEPEISIADVNGDGEVAIYDAIQVINFVNWEPSVLDDMDYELVVLPTVDLNDDSEVGIYDAVQIINYVNWEPSVLDDILN